MEQNYKVYQLISFFTLRYSYNLLMLKDPTGKTIKNGEFYLLNKDNKSYSLIRISTDSNYYLNDDEERLNNLVKSLALRFNFDANSFLNIYLTDYSFNETSKFKNISIQTNFYSGIDLSDVYPGIKYVVHDVEDGQAEINRILHDINEDLKNKRKFKLSKFRIKHYVSFIVGVISVLFFIGYSILKTKYSDSASLIFMGADYRMFTYGIGQYWRLITCAFNHGSIAHLICNLYSLYMIGTYTEDKYGHLKYAIVLLLSVLAGSLTFGIFNSNDLTVGLSGGLYGIWALYLTEVVVEKHPVSTNFYYIIALNIGLNFLSNVAWQCHLGGFICGILFYFIYNRKEQFIGFALCTAILFGGLGFKYFSSTKISPIYSGTDYEVCEIIDDLGFEKLATNTYLKLIEEYINQGYIGE